VQIQLTITTSSSACHNTAVNVDSHVRSDICGNRILELSYAWLLCCSQLFYTPITYN